MANDPLSDVFEEKERELFGKNCFENIVNRVASIEKQLGIYNLSELTPQLKTNN